MKKMLIKRSDKVYKQFDKETSPVTKYRALYTLLKARYYTSFMEKSDQEAIEAWSTWDETAFTSDLEIERIKDEIFIIDFDSYKSPSKQAWVNIDFSLSEEELISQIKNIKHIYEKGNDFFEGVKPFYVDDKIRKEAFEALNPIEFSKSIKQNFGDLLFIYDSTLFGYKRIDIINSVYDYRLSLKDEATALTQDTIKKYLKKAEDVIRTFE